MLPVQLWQTKKMAEKHNYTVRSFRGYDVADTYQEALEKADKMIDDIIPQWAEEYWWAEIRNNVSFNSQLVYKWKIGLVKAMRFTTWLHLI